MYLIRSTITPEMKQKLYEKHYNRVLSGYENKMKEDRKHSKKKNNSLKQMVNAVDQAMENNH